jgi:hypothetical protein
MPPISFNWNISVADMLVVCAATWAAARWIVGSLRAILHRMDLHEDALIRAGWLVRNSHGDLVVRDAHRAGV